MLSLAPSLTVNLTVRLVVEGSLPGVEKVTEFKADWRASGVTLPVRVRMPVLAL